MKKLMVSAQFVNPYNEKVVDVFMHYGTSKHPQDHAGNEIGLIVADDKRIAFQKHLEDKALALRNMTDMTNTYCVGFKFKNETEYFEYLNQAPALYLMISRRDAADIKQDELPAIKNFAKQLTTKLNNQHTCDASTLFSNNKCPMTEDAKKLEAKTESANHVRKRAVAR